MVATSHTNKRLAELAAHFQLEGHDDVFVLTSSTRSTTTYTGAAVPNRKWSSTADQASSSPVFNICLAILATGAAILALHLIHRQYFDEKSRLTGGTRLEEEKTSVASTICADREIMIGELPSTVQKKERQEEDKETTLTRSDPPDLIQEQQPRDQVTAVTVADMAPPRTIDPLPRFGSNQDSGDVPARSLVAGTYHPRPLKARVQELVEISNGIDGLNQSTALDVAVRVAQMQSNEHMRLMELAFRQNTRVQQANQKERHHRETIDEQGKERKWRQRLDSRFRDTVDELLSSTSTLGTLLILAVLCNQIEIVWNEFKVDPFAYATALVCYRAPTEATSSRTPTSIWFVGTWAYEYLQSTKTEMNCGLSIAQYLTAIVMIIGIQGVMPGMLGKVLQHACIAGALAKLSLRLLELEDTLWVAATVATFFIVSGCGVVCYTMHTKNYIIRQQRLPTILEMDSVEDVLDQARLGFIFCKALAALFLINRAACIVYWGKAA
jgi:hypothetical protein